jgi:peptide/nickel transport system substrate-binding protein
VKRAALLIKLNELAVGDHVPIVARPGVAGLKHKLVAELTGWDNSTWDLASWYLEA